MPATGTILKYNQLWRGGMHYDYKFFKVTHTTLKGNVMGHYIAAERTNEAWDHDYSTDRWIVKPSRIVGKRNRRLPHSRLWEPMNADELEVGIRQTSCVY